MSARTFIAAFCILAPLAVAGRALADQEPWTVYFPSAWRGCEQRPDAKENAGRSLSGPSSPRLLRPTNAPGKPLTMPDWLRMGRRQPRACVSGTLGLVAIMGDSCWSDSTRIRPCTPGVAVIDTLGVCRASFSGASAAAWSPNGHRLAILTGHTPTYRGKDATLTYPWVPDGVTVLIPATGEIRSFPAPTDVISWEGNESLVLEFKGRRYGLNTETGHAGHAMFQRAEPTIMDGDVSPDEAYVYRPGTLKLWSLVGRESDCVNCPPIDPSTPGHEGLDKDLSDVLVGVLGGSAPDFISSDSFWVCGPSHPHDLCLGVAWFQRETHRLERCEVVIVDVQRRVVTRRFNGSLVASASDGKVAVVWYEGRATFTSL